MKRVFAAILAFLLFLAPAALAEEDPAGSAAGDWYADLNGFSLTLSLKEDGSYTLALPAGIGEPASGTWTFDGGFVRLDSGAVLSLVSESLLLRTGDDLFFTREPVQYYAPADLLPGVPAELFAGYWKCGYADLGEAVVPASALDSWTDLYVEGTSAILGGSYFGDTQVKMEFADGAMSCGRDGMQVTLQIQQDGVLRMTVTGSETAPPVLYLTAVQLPGLEEDGI